MIFDFILSWVFTLPAEGFALGILGAIGSFLGGGGSGGFSFGLGGSQDKTKGWLDSLVRESSSSQGYSSTGRESESQSFAERFASELSTRIQQQQIESQRTSASTAATSGTQARVGQTTSTGGEQLTSFDTFGKAALDTLTQVLGESLDLSGSDVPAQYGKDQAIMDSRQLMQGMMQAAAEKVFPSLVEMQAGAGSFNSTTAQLLRDKAVAQAGREAAQLQFDTINNYANIAAQQQEIGLGKQDQILNSLIGALGLQGDAVKNIIRQEETAAQELTSEEQLQQQLQKEQESQTGTTTDVGSTQQTSQESQEATSSEEERTASAENINSTRDEETNTRGQATSVGANIGFGGGS